MRGDGWCVVALGEVRSTGADIESLSLASLIEPVRTMLLKVDRARIVRARGFYRSEDLVATWTALEARAKATGARLDNLELPGSKVQDPELFTVLNPNVPFQVKITL